MQAVLCLAFCGSLALAQWVVRDRRVNGSTSLESVPIFLGPIGIRGPRGWELKSQSEHPVRYIAEEPQVVGMPVRTLLIRERKVRIGMTAEAFLGPISGVEFGLPSEPVKIGTVDGILTSRQSREDTEMAPESGPIVNEWIAGCVGPTGIAISIQLTGPEETEIQHEEDKQLIRDVARAIRVQTGPDNQQPDNP